MFACTGGGTRLAGGRVRSSVAGIYLGRCRSTEGTIVMARNIRELMLVGTIASAAFSVSCGTADEPPLAEEVDVVMDPLQLYQAQNDPVFSGGSPTVCTIGGVTMHCCPNWQTGNNHYVMIGVNLATNTFRCARLDDYWPHREPVTLAPAGATQYQSVTFDPACPGGAMVGLHWDQKRVACAKVSGRHGEGLHPFVDYNPGPPGMKFCEDFSGSTSAGRVMAGIRRNDPSTFLCLQH
jgi:hypothetical protein